jgi:hypothetical protein
MDLSNCCNKPVIVIGRVTKFYNCTSCNKPCDAHNPNILTYADIEKAIEFFDMIKTKIKED